MSELHAGIAKGDLTPPVGALLFGYGFHRPATLVDDKLFATALVLRRGEKTVALVSLDWCLIDEEDTALIQEAVSEATGIAPRDVTLSCSHTHSGPVTVTAWGWGIKDREYLAKARGIIAQTVKAAQEKLEPVTVGIGVSQTDLGINRREVEVNGALELGFNDWGARDRDLTLVRFEGKAGPIAQLIHATGHPTSRGQDPAISRDWPGVMIDRVETVTKTPVLFINGAFGDVAPRTTIGGPTGDGAIAAAEVGLRAAYDAVVAWQKIKEFRADFNLDTLHADLVLPHAPLPPLEEAQRELEALPNLENGFGTEACLWAYWDDIRKAYATEIRPHRVFKQTIVRLGPIAIVPFGGEVFAEIGLRLKKASPLQHTLIAGTTNGSHGYYVTRESRGRGGYEVWVGRAYSGYLLRDDIDDVLVAENMKFLTEIAGR